MPSPEPTNEALVLQVAAHEAGQRLDAFLAARLTRFSRAQLRRAISTSGVTVDGKRTKVAYRLLAGQRVEVVVPQLPREGPEPENIPLDVLYEDEHLIAINKPAGMIVHPAKGHWSGTLAGALAYRFGQLSSSGGPTRPGIIHRLDRDTSGVLVVAKTNEVHASIASQFEARRTRKEYFAIVQGVPDRDSDVIARAVGTHPNQREKMAIRSKHTTSRDATTRYKVIERFDRFAALEVIPRTGRTHQIRVHLAHIGCPILCDRLYAGRSTITRGQIRGGGRDEHVLLDRLALHAKRLKITHPESGQPIEFIAPLPEDLLRVLAELRSDRAQAAARRER